MKKYLLKYSPRPISFFRELTMALNRANKDNILIVKQPAHKSIKSRMTVLICFCTLRIVSPVKMALASLISSFMYV